MSLYKKNLPVWERSVRTLAGLAMIAVGIYYLRASLIGYLLDASGVSMIAMGFFGWCPMCYVGGRKSIEGR